MRADVLEKTLHEMAAGGASELVLTPGGTRASNGGNALAITELPALRRRPLESLLMRLAGTERWASFMAAPGKGLTFIHRNAFRFEVRYEPAGPVAVIKLEGTQS